MRLFKVVFEWPKDPSPFWNLDLGIRIRQHLEGLIDLIQSIGGYRFVMDFKDEEIFALFMLMFPQDELGIYLTPICIKEEK